MADKNNHFELMGTEHVFLVAGENRGEVVEVRATITGVVFNGDKPTFQLISEPKGKLAAEMEAGMFRFLRKKC
ncbi:MAG: hypothetical protein WAV41_05075 [Microgenomates group bacterium]